MKIKNTNLTATATFEYEQVPHNQATELYFMTSIKAPLYEPQVEEGKESAPLDVVCVIDKSGSMSGEKIKLVRKSLSFMVEQMKSHDHLSIVLFDSNIETVLKTTKMDQNGKIKAQDIISKIKENSCTNLSGGLFEGYSIIQDRTSESNVCSMLLFTDGLANEGMTQTSQIVNAIQNQKEKLKGPCPVYTFGFGGDHDEKMLKMISEVTNGMYYYVGKEDDIPTCFADCFGGLASIVAQNIKLTIKTTKDVIIEKSVSTLYKPSFNENKTQVDLPIGDIYSEEFRDLVFKLKVPKIDEENGEWNVLDVTISYFNVIEKSIEKISLSGNLKRPKKIEGTNKPNVELDKQRNRIETADAIDQATNLADQDRLGDAKDVINKMISKLQESVSAKESFTENLITDLKQILSKLENRNVYKNEGSKWMNNFGQAQKNQRCTKPEMFSSTRTYETSNKFSMKSKFK